MKLPHNIETHPCAPGYLGYDAQGYAWRIQKSSSSYGNWCATSKHCPNEFIFAWRLADMGQKLEQANQKQFD
jgi:hypothetical protein